MDTYREFNPYSCKEYVLGVEKKVLDLEEIRRDCTWEESEKSLIA